jgi:CelD/BcsL family acetyltransferase involved in cellulose biosynthesis
MPDVRVEAASGARLDRWDELCDTTDRATTFHRMGVLRAIERESGTRLHPLVLLSDDRVVALFPVFEQRRAGIRLAFSPPAGCAVPALGPVWLTDPANRSDAERDWFGGADALVAYIRAHLRPDVERYGFSEPVTDLRPWNWAGYGAVPLYSYLLPLADGPDALFARFKAQVRTDARRAAKYEDLSVVNGGVELLRELLDLTRERYREQGITWAPSTRYFEDVYHAAPGRVAIKAVMAGGRMVAGLGLLVDARVVRHWIGGIAPKDQYIGVNELLHWETIREYQSRGFAGYEMMGANTRHLCRHKSRYNPVLTTYYRVGRRTRVGTLAETLSSGALRSMARRVLRYGRGAAA